MSEVRILPRYDFHDDWDLKKQVRISQGEKKKLNSADKLRGRRIRYLVSELEPARHSECPLPWDHREEREERIPTAQKSIKEKKKNAFILQAEFSGRYRKKRLKGEKKSRLPSPETLTVR